MALHGTPAREILRSIDAIASLLASNLNRVIVATLTEISNLGRVSPTAVLV